MASRLLDGNRAVFPGAALGVAIAVGSVVNPLLALAAVGGLGVLLLVVARAELLLLVLVATFPWENLLAFPTETLNAVKLLGFLLLIAYLIRALAGRQQVVLAPTLPAIAIFGLLEGLSLLFSETPETGVSKSLRYLSFALLFFLIPQLVRDRERVFVVLRIFCASAAAAAAWGLYGFLILGRTDRAAGPIQDPNDFAYLMASVLPFTILLLRREPRLRLVWGTCTVLLVAGVLATLSRGALVGIGAVAVWAVVTGRIGIGGLLGGALTLAGVTLLAFTLFGSVLSNRLEQKDRIAAANVGSRQAYWSAALRMNADHPLLGVGPDRFPDEAPTYVRSAPLVLVRPVVHNSYLEILAENGAPALLAFLAYLAGTWSLVSRMYRRAVAASDREGRQLATAMQASLVLAITSATFLSEQLTTPLWLLGGLAAALWAQGNAAGGDRPLPRAHTAVYA